MRYDLKTPCKNCPFRNDDTRIVFATRGRASDIEEHAYRHGFPCHLSAEHVEDCDTPDGESGGFYPGENTQHCAGAIIMFLKDGGSGSPWPGIDNDEELLNRLEGRIDWDAPVFESTEAFLDANTAKDERHLYE